MNYCLEFCFEPSFGMNDASTIRIRVERNQNFNHHFIRGPIELICLCGKCLLIQFNYIANLTQQLLYFAFRFDWTYFFQISGTGKGEDDDHRAMVATNRIDNYSYFFRFKYHANSKYFVLLFMKINSIAWRVKFQIGSMKLDANGRIIGKSIA